MVEFRKQFFEFYDIDIGLSAKHLFLLLKSLTSEHFRRLNTLQNIFNLHPKWENNYMVLEDFENASP